MARFHNGMRPVHPGEILREEFLAPLGMSANALAVALHVTAARINDIVRERRGITPDTAMRLARYFGGDAESWLNLQQSYDLKVAQRAYGKEIAAQIAPRDLEAA
ncbi:HigA family addiction module antitoxin [Cupriavidus basilensis]|uniref:HigA family addiction module antitoxin n=1 Tax=Cupriavidus basilensis TaxID=68895 RepID=UPI0020A643EB|nr:HigA family addiction module antitoxin [Cupriavidus basilensis]MCP3019067.1 HigA family addiction module antitoxin [Cupriavidus basilensis]